ncbi:MAG: carbohydrate ABC transporter permease [Oscillospiraceae bacterium]|jgi:multiple sugar transport system permease protein|nr:carbohydrate ABC transporter permease [Oscillospiraceae bacterium]
MNIGGYNGRRRKYVRGQYTGVIREFDAKTPGVRAMQIFIYVLCGIIALICIFPIIWVFLAGFKDLREFMSSTSILPRSFDFSRYVYTWERLRIYNNYLNSLYVVAVSVISALIFNGLMAYGLAILKPKGYKVLNALVMLSMLIPSTISIVPLFVNIQHLDMGGFFLPLWLAAGANTFFVVLFRQFFESFPKSIIEASRIDGCSSLQIFSKIILPLSKPICVVVAIYAINGAWSDFLLPYLVLNGTKFETVMVRLYTYSTQQTATADNMMRSVVFSMIPPIILFFIFQKKLTTNIITSGIKE